MFDKLEDLVARLDELQNELSDPNVASNAERFKNLMKEQANLAPIVEKYQEYKEAKQTIEDSISMLEGESDEEMREMLKEELSSAKQQVEQCENELKILLLPKDPNDERNVILEIRAGAGGDEAALFAAELYRMYVHYAESRHWKVELMEAEEIGIGGMKSVTAMVTGNGAYSVLKYESGVHRVQRVPETESGGRIHNEHPVKGGKIGDGRGGKNTLAGQLGVGALHPLTGYTGVFRKQGIRVRQRLTDAPGEG